MKSLLLQFAAFFCVLCTQAQNKKVDSLNNLIAQATTDTARINLLNAKANAYTENNLDSSLIITQANIAAARQVHYLKGEADAYRIAGTAFSYKGAFKPALDNYKSAEQLYKQIADSNGLNNVNRGYGMNYGMQSKYDSSIIYFKKNMEYDERNKKDKDLSSAYQNIAVSYTMMSNYTQAMYYQAKALKLAESKNDISNLAYINLNMGISYSNIYDYVRSEVLFHKAIQYAQQAQITNVELYGYANLASTCIRLGRYQETYDNAMKAATLGRQLGDDAIVASSLARAAEALAYQKNYTKAEQLATQAIAIGDSAGSPMNSFQTLVSMGLIKKLQQQYPQAIQYYEKGFAVLKNADLYDDQIGSAYNGLSEAYEHEGQYQKALSTFKTSAKIADSIRSRENIRKATEQSMNDDFAKKEQVIKAEQDEKNTLADARQSALMIGLGFTILLIAGAVVAYRNKQKANVLLRHQKEELQKTLGELKATQNQLVQSEKMASLGELTAGIAHEIQNPLNFVNNFSEVSQEMLDEMEEEINAGNTEAAKSLSEEVKQNLQKILHHGKRADSIVKGMLMHSRNSTGQKELVNINTLANEYLRLSYHGLRAKDKSFNATIHTSFDEQIGKINIVPQDVGRAMLNLFTNAFYAVHQKQKKLNDASYVPTVQVHTKKSGNMVEIRVKDNGNGIPDKIASKIFQPFFTTKPTGEGTGLGLSLSYDIITKAHGGSLSIHSQEGEYAEFVITLPT